MKRWFYLIVGLQLLFLAGEAAKYHLALTRGRAVFLKVAPVDPRSLFLGNYMALRYDISSLDLSKIAHDPQLSHASDGDTVYVVLVPAKPWARAVEVAAAEPPRSEARPFLKGRVEGVYHNTLWVDYGLERYYIPEAAQERVNELARRSWQTGKGRLQLTVEVAVQTDGRALIRRVLANGTPIGF
jgi:uncharacterized membrane-anchored protein